MNDQFFLENRYKQSVTQLFKEMLKIVEDMKADHDFHYSRLAENLPDEYLNLLAASNHFDERKFKWIRKKILDTGNQSLRDFASEMENFTVSFIFKQ